MRSASAPRPATYAGLFLVALATLLFELSLTRIFSVTMWYHFAFMAVSVAMFGMTVGAVVVFLRPRWFPPSAVGRRASQAAILFALSLPVSVLAHIATPFQPAWSVIGLFSIGFTYCVVALPLILSGIVISVMLTRHPNHVGGLYAADLLGAALGCLLFVGLLDVMDAPSAVVFTALLAAISGLLFALSGGYRFGVFLSATLTVGFGIWASVGAVRAAKGTPLVRLTHLKGAMAERPIYEKWNSFSRVAVFGDPVRASEPVGWGMSPRADPRARVRQLSVNIDGSAATVLTHFEGRPEEIQHLGFDVINFVYQIRPGGRALIVGVGGGRDILSALYFGSREVVGVEINADLLEVLNGQFGDFTGHLDRRPDVRFAHDEARSWLTRSDEQFDVIQVSLIDTWAATAAGAFVFTENGLYTVDAWKVFLQHLTPTGVLTFSRWYYGARPAEIYRLVGLAQAGLEAAGVRNTRGHIILVRRVNPFVAAADGIGTLLVSRQPFSRADVQRVVDTAQAMQFEVVLDPFQARDEMLAALASEVTAAQAEADYPLDITPPTDDHPFFFHTLRLRDAFNADLARQGVVAFNANAIFILAVLLAISIGLSLVCIVAPLVLTAKRGALRGSGSLFVFFASIGIGFMLIEISQMQRLSVFLGHPTYGLTIVLFSLLVSSGVGSYATRWGRSRSAERARVLLLPVALLAFGVLSPWVIAGLIESSTPVRLAVAATMLAPIGLFMGIAFPTGMTLALRRSPDLAPWLWGVNGAMSVCASVAALVVALSWGISASFWAGVFFYLVAAAAWARETRTQRTQADPNRDASPVVVGRIRAL